MWLVGGASLLAFALCYALTGGAFQQDTADGVPLWVFYASAYYASFACNYPHFLYSYMLFYPSLFKRLSAPDTTAVSKIRLIIAGFLVPALMIVYFVCAWHLRNPRYLSWAVSAMFFSVGWHYVKQGYGSLITLSLYENIFYSVWEKRLLNVNAYVVWVSTYIAARAHPFTGNYFDLSYTTLAFPSRLIQCAYLLSYLTTGGVISLLLKRRLYDKKGISFSGVLGYVAAIYMWVVQPFGTLAFIVFIPFFHSLQYLPFVYKYKKSEALQRFIGGQDHSSASMSRTDDGAQKVQLRIAASIIGFAVGGIILGAVFFEWLPKYMDAAIRIHGVDEQFFLISFIVFINIHHFFIDNAFWRKDNSDVQRYLFQA